MSITKNQIVEAYRSAQSAVNTWNDLPEEAAQSLGVTYQGRKVVAISTQVLEAFSVLIGLCATSDIETDAQTRGIVLACDRFALACSRWWSQLEREILVNPSGTPEMWSAFELIGDAIDAAGRVWPQPTPIGQQPKGTSLQTIANQYGWTVQQVTEEMAVPGTHYDPSTWVHPSRRAKEKRINEQWATRKVPEATFSHLAGSAAESGGEATSTPVIEPPKSVSIEDLQGYFEEGMSAQQIANITGLSIDEVREFGTELGFDGNAPVSPAVPINEQVAAENKLAAEAKERQEVQAFDKSHPEITDLDSRILACHRDGMKPRRICELLGRDRSGVSMKHVVMVIKEAAKAK